jgi:S1-C subfamily serine protease
MNVARRVADEIIRTGKMQWPWLGVSTTTLTQARAAELGLAAKRGALVLAVQKDSPAAQARLEPNDVIAQVGNTQTKTAEDLVAAIRTHKPGQDVSLKVWRGGKEITVTVRLGVAPSAPVAPPPPRRQR